MSIVEPEEIYISYRRPLFLSIKKITDSKHAFTAMMEYLKDQHYSIDYLEYTWLICLSRNNGIVGINLISQGGVAGTAFSITHLLHTALLQNASAVIFIHNHPSGSTQASPQDVSLTKEVTKAFKAVSIELIDHLIITTESYSSFADEGLL